MNFFKFKFYPLKKFTSERVNFVPPELKETQV